MGLRGAFRRCLPQCSVPAARAAGLKVRPSAVHVICWRVEMNEQCHSRRSSSYCQVSCWMSRPEHVLVHDRAHIMHR